MSKKKRGSAADDLYNNHLFGYGNKYYPSTAARREFEIQRMLERTITELAMNRFKWDGLEDTGIDQRFLEMCLFYNGLAVVYMDRDYDKLLAVRGTGTGYVNMLDNPVSFTVIGPGTVFKPTTDTAPAQFQNKTLSAYQPVAHADLEESEKQQKAVPIWANYLRYPDVDIVRIYSSRLATIDRTIEINSKNARRNKILKGTPNMQLSMVNTARAIDNGDELVQVTGALQDMDFIEALDLGILPESYEKISILRGRIWNECMSLLGLDNANQDKKERMVAAEVTANDEQSDSMKFVNLNARRQACEMINDVFGTNLSVNYYTEDKVEQEREDAMNAQPTNQNGDNSGNVHTDAE